MFDRLLTGVRFGNENGGGQVSVPKLTEALGFEFLIVALVAA